MAQQGPDYQHRLRSICGLIIEETEENPIICHVEQLATMKSSDVNENILIHVKIPFPVNDDTDF